MNINLSCSPENVVYHFTNEETETQKSNLTHSRQQNLHKPLKFLVPLYFPIYVVQDEATSHMWVFTFKSIKLKKNSNSVPQLHLPYCKCSAAIKGWWLWHWTVQTTEHFHLCTKFLWGAFSTDLWILLALEKTTACIYIFSHQKNWHLTDK